MKRKQHLKFRPKRITPPKFFVCGETYNEYEIWQLMLDVKDGRLDAGVEITDERGHSTTIREDGRLVGDLYRFNLTAKMALDLI